MVMNESPERMKIDIDVGLGRAGMTRIEFLIGRIEVLTRHSHLHHQASRKCFHSWSN